MTDQRYPANRPSVGETAPDAVTGMIDRLIARIRTMPPNGVISRWENVSRSSVIDLLLDERKAYNDIAGTSSESNRLSDPARPLASPKSGGSVDSWRD